MRREKNPAERRRQKLVFGVPRALGPGGPLTDARIPFALAAMAATAAALRLTRREPPAKLRIFQALFVLPVTTLLVATGGDDVPVLALMILSLALLEDDHAVAAGIALGTAAAYLLVRRPPRTPARAAFQAGLVFALAILVAPAARSGYAIYPVSLIAWGLLAAQTGSGPRPLQPAVEPRGRSETGGIFPRRTGHTTPRDD